MGRKIKKPPKLNLIPILDAIFIFIFFLLMSAQFLDIYEIGSDAPITSSSEELPKDKKPLNLVLQLSEKKIIIKTGLDENILKTIELTKLSELNTSLIELKKQYPKENSAILRPDKKFKYEDIVKVIDKTRQIEAKGVFISAIDNKNKKIQTQKLFENIIFDTQD